MHKSSKSHNSSTMSFISYGSSNKHLKFKKKLNIINSLNSDIECLSNLNHHNPECYQNLLVNLNKSSDFKVNDRQANTILKFIDNTPEIYDEKRLSHKNRTSNIRMESNLESKRKELEEKIKILKSELNKLYLDLTSNKNFVSDYKIDLLIFENFNKYCGYEAKMNKLFMKNIENNDYEQFMKMKNMFENGEIYRNSEINSKKEDLVKIQENVQNIRRMICFNEEKIEKYQKELQSIKNALIIHYHKILAEGKDTRKEGLIWIIKSIWKLGIEVVNNHLPSFLDEISINFLFEYAKKDIEIADVRQIIDDFKLSMKKIREKLSNTIDEIYSLKKIQEIIQYDGELDEQIKEYITKIKELEHKYGSIQSHLQVIILNELNRINKEFYTNNYERRYAVTQEDVESALIGEDNTFVEIARQKREKNKYLREIKNIRYFNIFNNKLF